MTMSIFTLPFEQCDKAVQNRVGGKCASLGVMTQAGLPVPSGFAVTTEAYAAMLASDNLRAHIAAILATVVSSDDKELEPASAQIRRLIEATPMSVVAQTDIRTAYQTLSQRCGLDAVSVAVRSSATAEDMPDASFAGQQDTYLWVTGADDVIHHIRKCWSSLFTARAIAYRLDRGIAHLDVAMSVAVQKMVNARAAGVAFTLNPINGDRSKIAIDSSWGLGEAVVSGEVTPDNFLLDKVVLTVIDRTISAKHIEFARDGASGGTLKRPVEPERVSQSSLTDDELMGVAQLAKRAEKHYRQPQDVEWAIDADLPAPNNVVLLQARPETVWSRTERPSVSQGDAEGIAGLVQALSRGIKLKTD